LTNGAHLGSLDLAEPPSSPLPPAGSIAKPEGRSSSASRARLELDDGSRTGVSGRRRTFLEYGPLAPSMVTRVADGPEHCPVMA